jgi:hypothetical protein
VGPRDCVNAVKKEESLVPTRNQTLVPRFSCLVTILYELSDLLSCEEYLGLRRSLKKFKKLHTDNIRSLHFKAKNQGGLDG